MSCETAAHKIVFSGTQLRASPKKALRLLAIQSGLPKDTVDVGTELLRWL